MEYNSLNACLNVWADFFYLLCDLWCTMCWDIGKQTWNHEWWLIEVFFVHDFAVTNVIWKVHCLVSVVLPVVVSSFVHNIHLEFTEFPHFQRIRRIENTCYSFSKCEFLMKQDSQLDAVPNAQKSKIIFFWNSSVSKSS